MENKKENRKKIAETFRLGLLLCLVGGFTDAYTFTIRGKVLANAQTGNMVFFALRLIEMKWMKALFYFLPIAAFGLGILIAEYIKEKFKYSRIHWRQIIILMEIVVLLVSSFVPKGELNVYVNIAISFVCSLQVQAFRKIRGNISATTMCTGNLRSGTENLYHYLTTKDRDFKHNVLIYYGLIVFFMIGAITGSFFSELLAEKALLVCCGILFIVFTVMFKDNI